MPDLQRSVNKAVCCTCLLQWREKITLDEEGISEILVADTDSLSGTEASDFENDFEEEKEEDQHQLQEASADIETQAATSVDYQPGDRLKEGTQIFILMSVQQKV